MTLKALAALLPLAAFAAPVAAGELVTANYGHFDAFTIHRSGQAICDAIAGVVPKGSRQFPARRFETTKTATVKPSRWNESEALDFETECVRAAISSMMDTDPTTVYRAP